MKALLAQILFGGRKRPNLGSANQYDLRRSFAARQEPIVFTHSSEAAMGYNYAAVSPRIRWQELLKYELRLSYEK